jgi:hypothetical protein
VAGKSSMKPLERVSADRIRADVFHLSADPLPFRKLNYTLPGHDRCTLYEADDLIEAELRGAGWPVERQGCPVQAFRCDASKPKAHQYSPPHADDPTYAAYNLWAEKPGASKPDEIILLCAHKDSQSWVDSPGAHDNATGTAGLTELARALADYTPSRTIRLLFCNEEHYPWTSVAAAVTCRDRGDNLIAVLNCDGFGARTQGEIEADVKAHGMLYTKPEAKPLTDLLVGLNDEMGLGLRQIVTQRERPGDDDGSFVNAGYGAAVFTGGGGAGEYPYYHRETDTPETVDVESVRLLTVLTLAAVLHIDEHGAPQT